MLVTVLLCGQGELLASGVRVLVKNVPVDRLVQKFTLKNFPAQTLKREAELVPSAAAFVDELLQASCLSCFDKIFAEENFKRYRIVEQPDATEYVKRHASPLLRGIFDYNVTVAYNEEATIAASLLDKFAELDKFYQALHKAKQQLDTDMPATGVRREAFIAQQEKYSELYQHTRAEIDTALADLRGLLDAHGREYPQDILASVDNLEAHLRQLTQARASLERAVVDEVTPRMAKLQNKAEMLGMSSSSELELKIFIDDDLNVRLRPRNLSSSSELELKIFIDDDLNVRLRPRNLSSSSELELGSSELELGSSELELGIGKDLDMSTRTRDSHDLYHDEQQKQHVDHHVEHQQQQKQHQDTMTAFVAIDPLDIF